MKPETALGDVVEIFHFSFPFRHLIHPLLLIFQGCFPEAITIKKAERIEPCLRQAGIAHRAKGTAISWLF